MVFFGGGLGSLCRYGIGKWMDTWTWNIPMGTFAANMLACLILGLVMGQMMIKNDFPSSYKLFLATGFCGGFSTFSTFSFENVELLRVGDIALAMLYTGLSIVVGLAFIVLGIKMSGAS